MPTTFLAMISRPRYLDSSPRGQEIVGGRAATAEEVNVEPLLSARHLSPISPGCAGWQRLVERRQYCTALPRVFKPDRPCVCRPVGQNHPPAFGARSAFRNLCAVRG